MKHFEEYLIKKGFVKSTVFQYIRYVEYFLSWLKMENIKPKQTKHNNLIHFLDYAANNGKSLNNRSKIILAIRHYFDYLLKGKTGINPAQGINLKGKTRHIFNNIIDFSLLEAIYQDYPTETIRQQRNKLILGFLIYQGITTEELHLLQAGLIDLNKGKITLPAGKRTNSRVLDLKAGQIIPISNYLNHTRNKIINDNGFSIPQLLLSTEGNIELKNTLHHLFRELSKVYPNVRNAKQIRIIVIQNWLKTYNLRQVQYLAGHKYVSSTESYLNNNIDDLQNEIEKLHPMQ